MDWFIVLASTWPNSSTSPPGCAATHHTSNRFSDYPKRLEGPGRPLNTCGHISDLGVSDVKRYIEIGSIILEA